MLCLIDRKVFLAIFVFLPGADVSSAFVETDNFSLVSKCFLQNTKQPLLIRSVLSVFKCWQLGNDFDFLGSLHPQKVAELGDVVKVDLFCFTFLALAFFVFLVVSTSASSSSSSSFFSSSNNSCLLVMVARFRSVLKCSLK